MAAALLCAAAGALAVQGGARAWVAAALAATIGLALLLRREARPLPLVADPPPPRAPDEAAQLQLLLDHLPVALCRVDAQGELQALTQRARRLLARPVSPPLPQQLLERARVGQAGRLELDTESGCERWNLSLQTLQWKGETQTLLALVPLESALEAERQQAWQQLVQVLTHEIMNSLTPIASLAQCAGELDDAQERQLALATIAQRAEGLQRFVADYRRLSDVPAPQLQPVALLDVLSRLRLAFTPAWAARGGQALFELAEPSLLLRADPAQLEQALLNLITNAERATQGMATPRLWVEARLTRCDRLRITVRDNGPGVPAGLEAHIFLPFFSASEGGRGIGLTLARQLVHGMGGRLRYVRPLEGGAGFVLSF